MIQSYFTSLLSVKYLSLKFRESTAYSLLKNSLRAFMTFGFQSHLPSSSLNLKASVALSIWFSLSRLSRN